MLQAALIITVQLFETDNRKISKLKEAVENKYEITGYLNLTRKAYWWKWVSVRVPDVLSNLFLAKKHFYFNY